MRCKGLLSTALSLALTVAAVSGAAASPRHGSHHAKATTADKGGERHGPSDPGPSQGKGSDKADAGNASQGKGKGNDDSNDPGNANSGNKGNDGNGSGTNDNGPAGSSPGGGPGKSDPPTSADAPAAQGNGKGPGEDKPGRGATPDPTVSSEAPAALLAAGDVPLGSLPADLRPRVAVDVLVAPVAGQVLVQAGDAGFVPMDGPGRIPVGAFVDASRGVVTMVDKLPDGSTQTAVFSGSKFQVRQNGDGTTALVLRGSSFRDICGSVTAPAADGGPGARVPVASAARARSKKVVRSLWASDHNGKYQTYGRNGVATVRGTVWQTVDRCDGTLIRVAEGEVVVHDRRIHRDVVVAAGHSYLALDPQA